MTGEKAELLDCPLYGYLHAPENPGCNSTFFLLSALGSTNSSMRFRPGRYDPIFLAALMERPVNSALDIDSYTPFACFKVQVNDGGDSFKVHPMIANCTKKNWGNFSAKLVSAREAAKRV